jgi:glutathione peroxidase
MPAKSLYDFSATSIQGQPADFGSQRGKVFVIVNTASKCGFTPQFAGLEKLAADYKDRGLVVVGFPCNQFGHQDPGANTEIESFCQLNYGVTFPMMEKIDVNGANQHPIYAELNQVADGEGHTGDIRWNFEKFLVAPGGEVVARFSPRTQPDDPALRAAIDGVLKVDQ